MLRQIIRVSKFWRDYAGQLAVEAIDDKVMREFIPWRRDYYSLGALYGATVILLDEKFLARR